VRMLHGSRPNMSPRPRVGLAVRFVAPHVRQRGLRQGATLVRGADAFGNFDHEPEPRYDGDPVALKWHRRSRRRYAAELFWEVLRRPSPGNLLGAGRLMADPARLLVAIRSLWARPTAGLAREVSDEQSVPLDTAPEKVGAPRRSGGAS